MDHPRISNEIEAIRESLDKFQRDLLKSTERPGNIAQDILFVDKIKEELSGIEQQIETIYFKHFEE